LGERELKVGRFVDKQSPYSQIAYIGLSRTNRGNVSHNNTR